MTDLKPFRFYFLDETGNYYYVPIGFNVTTSSVPQELPQAPKGWAETEIKWNRSISYHGLVRTHSTPYEFVGDAAIILRHLYKLGGTEAYCKLRIEKIRSFDWLYETYYEAEIDFTQFDSNGPFVKVNLAEAGVGKYLRANEDTTYEIPIEASDCVNIGMDGILLEASFKHVPIEDDYIGPVNTNLGIRSPAAFYLKEGDYSPGEGSSQQRVLQAAFYTIGSPSQSITPQPDNKIYEAFLPSESRFYIRQKFDLTNDPSSANSCRLRVVILVADSAQNITNMIEVYNSAIVVPGSSVTLNIEETSTSFNLLKDDCVYLAYELYQAGGGLGGYDVDFKWYGNPTSEILYESALLVQFKLDPSTIRAYRLMQVFEKLTDKLSEGTFTGASTFLSNPLALPANNFDNIPFQTTITCGDAIRGLTTDQSGANVDPKIKTTFSDFFTAIKALQGVGLGQEDNTLVIEPLETFYRTGPTDLIYDFGEIANINIIPAQDYLGSILKVGYQKQDYDALNGKYEFNLTHEYKYDVKKMNKPVDLISTYRADMYGIELTRANLTNKKTIDSASDNENFFITIGDTPISGIYPLYRPQLTTAGLLSTATAFNLDLTPKRCFYRLGRFIAMQNSPRTSSVIKFQTATKNDKLESDLGTGTIVEKADVTVSSLGTPLFLPDFVKFKAVVPANILQLLATKPYGYFRFSCRGYSFRMFPFEVSVLPISEDVVDVTLLPLPDTNVDELMAAANGF